jgi:ribosome-associated toxin RatA of RatAB toxin-antitoxin module
MTHRNNFVAVVKCGGNILREHNSAVMLPFGSEYSIMLKNLDDRNASVGISIDGKSVTEDRDIVVYPNTTMELDGFMENAAVRKRFRFIKKTWDIMKHRGDNIDDGIIRVEFTFEKRIVEEVVHHTHVYNNRYWQYPLPWYPQYAQPWRPYNPVITYGSNTNGSDVTTGSVTDSAFCGGGAVSYSSNQSTVPTNCCSSQAPNINPDEGITVGGSSTHQSFSPVYLGELEDSSTVITIRLAGMSTNGDIKTPVAVKDKLRCQTCGCVSKSSAVFCSRCGTNIT